MLWWLIAIFIVSVGALWYLRAEQTRSDAREFEQATAEARAATERLGGQVYQLSPYNEAARQALTDAAERYNAAGGQIDRATTVGQAYLAKQSALEGLYYIRAARVAMDMDPGPPIPALEGQNIAGRVGQRRIVEHNGRHIAASPGPTARTPNYFPGGKVAGRPVPAGWYSEPWWRPALAAGAWGTGSALLFAALFTGMAGVGYDAQAFENGFGDDPIEHGEWEHGNWDGRAGSGLDNRGFDDGFDGF